MIDTRGRLSGQASRLSLNAQEVHRANKNKVLYVHVGKTGGQFVRQYFNSSLHGLFFQQLHVYALDSQMLREFEIIIISVRNPVDRLISAYYWWHPHLEGSERYGKTVNRFYECCPTLTEFGNALFANTECGSIARSQSLLSLKGHISMDTCAYLGGVMKELRAKREHVFLINTESMEADLKGVVERNHWTRKYYTPFNFSTLHLSHSQHPQSAPESPSESATGIRQAYRRENASQETRNQLSRYLDLTGELEMYAALQRTFGKRH